MANELIIIDQQQLQYENEILKLTVLGGIRLEGLDRMRVTIKAELKESPRPPFRHTVDLYNDTQLEKFIRKCAEKLEIPPLLVFRLGLRRRLGVSRKKSMIVLFNAE